MMRMGWDGREPGRSVMYYQPSSTTDLLDWKDNPPPSSEKLQAVVDLMESLFQILSHLGRTASSYHAMFNRGKGKCTHLREALAWLPGPEQLHPSSGQHGTSPQIKDRPAPADARRSSEESKQELRNP